MKTSKIPKDAREVYCNEKGEPIAWCPKDSLGITDIERGQFYNLNKDRLSQLADRAKEKTKETRVEQGVICIDVDDPSWTNLVDILMPGHDWDSYRSRGEKPVARGVVPRSLLALTVKEAYPAAGDLVDGKVNILIFAGGGIAIFPHER